MLKINKIIIAVVLIIAIGIVWSSSIKPAPASGESVKIGAVLGLTGPAAAWSDMSKKGIDLAVKEVNANGGINGRPLAVVYEDGQTNQATGISAFNKLVTVDGVSVVVGDVWSFITNPLIPVAEQKKVVLISPTVMDASVEKASPYFYTVGHTTDSQKAAIEKFFDTNSGVKTIAVLSWKDAWGASNRNLLLSVAEERGVKVVFDESLNDFSATYQNEITKVKATNPDAIYFTTALADTVLRKIKDLGLGDKPVLTVSLAIDAIEVNKTPVSYLKNVYLINWFANSDFTAKFNSEYGMNPIIEAQNSYDSVRAVAQALIKGGDFNTAIKTVKFTGAEGYTIDFTKGDQSRVNEGQANLYTYDGAYHKI